MEAPGLGALADWDIDARELLAEYPRLCIASLSGFGATGPYAGYAWSDLVVQAFTGALLADPLGPVKLPTVVGECAIGHTAAMGALAAVLRARATGAGAFVDCAATEALATNPTKMSLHLGWEYRDREFSAQVMPERSATVLPLGVLPCADGNVAMMMTPQQLGEMLEVLDNDELRAFFARPDAFVRPEAREILDGVLYPWLLERTRQEVTDAAQAAGWPVTPVNLPGEMLTADHLHQRGFWIHAVDPENGPFLLAGAPYRLTEGGWKLRRVAPRLGQSDSPTGSAGGRQAPAPPAAARQPDVPPLTGVRVLDLTVVGRGPC